MNDLLQCPDAPEPPRCFNRDPLPTETRRFGLDSQTGRVIEVVLSNEWFEDRCNSWRGTGIGPTPETTHYPQAHGWESWCRQCKWMPEDMK